MGQEEERVRVTGSGPGTITVAGLSTEEGEKLMGALNVGNWWVKNTGGRLETHSAFSAVPPSVDDEEMLPFWGDGTSMCFSGPPLPGPKYEKSGANTVPRCASPSITIQHLCGYSYTPEGYNIEAEKLRGWGFQCLRSQRGDDGQYWELWFLPGLWCAKGKLANAFCNEKAHADGSIEKAVEFLSKNCSFGTLDVSFQRLAMVID